MNCYALVEGASTEPKLLRAWFGIALPTLTEVRGMHLVVQDNFYVLSAKGYRNFDTMIPNALKDIEVYGNIDHFVVWADAEDDGYEAKLHALEDLTNAGSQIVRKHIIVANRCIETWLLGNRKMLKINPRSVRLREFKRFYDVSVQDPESMGLFPDHSGSTADFHYEYLRAMLQERNLAYTKKSQGPALEKHYFDALVDRTNTTGHIASFRSLLACLNAMGSEYA